MEARVRLLGHPVHPMLVMFPGALFITGTVADAVELSGDHETAGEVGFWSQTVGLAGGVLAAATGYADWTKIPKGTRARRLGRVHAACNAAALVLFGRAWAARVRNPGRAAGAGPLAL